jgi:predicted Zn-dependent protease with MMP-like domain
MAEARGWGYLGRGPHRCSDDGYVVELSEDEFDDLVAEALDTLPPDLARLMDNVVVFVENQKPGRPGLLGLYEGVPLTSRGHYYSGHLPDRITIYRLPIRRRCKTREEVVEQVRITVVHEIAHHFGIGEARLHELGYG